MSTLLDPGRREWHVEGGRLGMWVFIASEVLFFGALFLGYTHSRLADPAGFAEASRHTHLAIGTINTAILLTSSLAMAFAARAAALSGRPSPALWIAAALGAAFLALKLLEYSLEWKDGLVPGPAFTYSGPHAHGVARFFFLYFAMTGLHLVHLSIGIVATLWIAARVGNAPIGWREHRAVEVLGLYWHFVDAVWVFLYPMIYLVERWK